MFELIKKRGRPSTGQAMTPAERKAAQRKREADKGTKTFKLSLDQQIEVLDLIHSAFVKADLPKHRLRTLALAAEALGAQIPQVFERLFADDRAASAASDPKKD